MQPDFEGNLLIYANPEKFGTLDFEEEKPKPSRHPLQGEFILTRKIYFNDLKLADLSRNQHPRSTGARRT